MRNTPPNERYAERYAFRAPFSITHAGDNDLIYKGFLRVGCNPTGRETPTQAGGVGVVAW